MIKIEIIIVVTADRGLGPALYLLAWLVCAVVLT